MHRDASGPAPLSDDARAILDASPVPAVALTGDGRVDYANLTALETFGPAVVTSESLPTWIDAAAVGPSPRAAARRAIAALREGAELEAHRTRCRVTTRDGSPRDVEIAWTRSPRPVAWLLVEATSAGAGSAASASRLVELEARVADLEREATTDRLTGAWNRRFVDRVVRAEIERSRRHRQPLSALLLDLDGFKDVNDRLGHLAGDRVLRAVASQLQRRTRSTDAVVRWGGDEFLVVMPATTLTGARQVGEDLRTRLAALELADDVRVTVSLGVAEHRAEEDLESWVARADRALYAAKQAGRDRVAVDGTTAFPDWDARGRAAPLALVWSPDYACGDPGIDGQHEALFALANELLETAYAKRETGAALVAAFDRLHAHLEAHFRDEEDALSAVGWPGLPHHRVLHRDLLARSRALRADAETGAGSTGRLVEFLAFDGVARHLLEEDRAYFASLAAARDGRPA